MRQPWQRARIPGKLPILGLGLAIVITAMGSGSGVQAAQSAQQVPATEGLPEVSTIITRFVDAIGGEDLVRSLTSSRVTGSISVAAQGLQGELEMFAAAPNKLLVRSTLAGIGETATGFDGEIGWSVDPLMGPRLLAGKELDQIRDEADFYGDLYDPTTFTVMEVVGLEEIGGTDCYVVRFVRQSGLESHQYFATDSGLLRGLRGTQESVMGSVRVTTLVSEYQDFGGPRVPTLVVQEFGPGQMAEITVQSVEYNAVPASTFDLPIEIAALVGR